LSVWVLFSLVAVALVKYYTANEMRKLQHRLDAARAGLQRYKTRLEEVQQAQNSTEEDEGESTDRIRRMKEITEDLQVRLTAAAERTRADLVAESFEQARAMDEERSL